MELTTTEYNGIITYHNFESKTATYFNSQLEFATTLNHTLNNDHYCFLQRVTPSITIPVTTEIASMALLQRLSKALLTSLRCKEAHLILDELENMVVRGRYVASTFRIVSLSGDKSEDMNPLKQQFATFSFRGVIL